MNKQVFMHTELSLTFVKDALGEPSTPTLHKEHVQIVGHQAT